MHKLQEQTKSKRPPPPAQSQQASNKPKKPASWHLATVNTNQHEATSCSGVPSCAVGSAAPGGRLLFGFYVPAHTFLSTAPCFILGYQHLGGKDQTLSHLIVWLLERRRLGRRSLGRMMATTEPLDRISFTLCYKVLELNLCSRAILN